MINGSGSLRASRRFMLRRNSETVNFARMWTKHFLLMLDRKSLVDTAELCIAELVGNSIRHTTSSLIVLNMRPNDGSPLFEVWDNSLELPKFPEVVSFDDLEAESGRGLRLVKQLSQDCGTVGLNQVDGGGKLVWFRL